MKGDFEFEPQKNLMIFYVHFLIGLVKDRRAPQGLELIFLKTSKIVIGVVGG